jgi:hypothetical protein
VAAKAFAFGCSLCRAASEVEKISLLSNYLNAAAKLKPGAGRITVDAREKE